MVILDILCFCIGSINFFCFNYFIENVSKVIGKVKKDLKCLVS